MSVSIAQGVVATAPKQIVAGTNITTVETDTTITINSTGGSSGGVTISEVSLDFGSIPRRSLVATLVDAAITPTSKLLITPNGVDGDELDMDNFTCGAQCFVGSAKIYVQAIPGPVRGIRKFNYIIG